MADCGGLQRIPDGPVGRAEGGLQPVEDPGVWVDATGEEDGDGDGGVSDGHEGEDAGAQVGDLAEGFGAGVGFALGGHSRSLGASSSP